MGGWNEIVQSAQSSMGISDRTTELGTRGVTRSSRLEVEAKFDISRQRQKSQDANEIDHFTLL